MHHQDPGRGCGCAATGEHPVDALTREHRTILAVLDAIERQAGALRDGVPVAAAFWRDALDFVATYADRCHHGKEESLLFAELERAGLPGEHGPTACMRAEHEQGRRLRQAMAAALDRGDGRALATAAGDYVLLLREHIDKEDHVLFPLARSVLSADAVARLRTGFASVEHHDLGPGTHARYEDLAARLAAHDPRPAPR